jgi:hypothetical protein
VNGFACLVNNLQRLSDGLDHHEVPTHCRIVILVSELANAVTSWAAGRRPASGHGLDAGLALP